jgi:hypothetical protein
MRNPSQPTRRNTLAYLIASAGVCEALAQDAPGKSTQTTQPTQPAKKPKPSAVSRAPQEPSAKKEKTMPAKQVVFPDTPHEMWQRAVMLLDLNNIVITAKAIEDAFGFRFDIVDIESGRDGIGNPINYSHEFNSTSLGRVKIFAWEWKDRIRWGVAWDKKSCDVPMRNGESKNISVDSIRLGWRVDKKGPPIGKTNSANQILEFFPTDEKRFEGSESRTKFNLTFPSYNDECLIEIYAAISKVN